MTYKTYRPYVSLLLLLLALFVLPAHAQWLPTKSNHLVNDYSQILSKNEANKLEQRLIAFNDSTSNQILIVITPTLGGDEVMNVAQRIGEQWGVGQAQFDNGVVILIKSKTRDENWGDVAIATGYGVEGVLPDIFCKRIIDDAMIEPLGDGDYYAALTAALDIIEPVLAGEYNYELYQRDKNREARTAMGVFFGLIVLVIVILIIYSKKHPGSWNSGGGSSFGGGPIFFGGGRGGGFSGGGFGGFGGGSFGGGGASGRF